jgi:hypothetical protein
MPQTGSVIVMLGRWCRAVPKALILAHSPSIQSLRLDRPPEDRDICEAWTLHYLKRAGATVYFTSDRICSGNKAALGAASRHKNQRGGYYVQNIHCAGRQPDCALRRRIGRPAGQADVPPRPIGRPHANCRNRQAARRAADLDVAAGLPAAPDWVNLFYF